MQPILRIFTIHLCVQIEQNKEREKYIYKDLGAYRIDTTRKGIELNSFHFIHCSNTNLQDPICVQKNQ